MNRALALIILYSLTSSLNANEVHTADPIHYEVSGNDIYANKGYVLNISLDRSQKDISVSKIEVHIYDYSIEIPDEILMQVKNPAIERIEATNDAGIFGSYFYISIPFGKGNFFCKKQKYIYVSNQATMDGGGLEAGIIDPCKKS